MPTRPDVAPAPAAGWAWTPDSGPPGRRHSDSPAANSEPPTAEEGTERGPETRWEREKELMSCGRCSDSDRQKPPVSSHLYVQGEMEAFSSALMLVEGTIALRSSCRGTVSTLEWPRGMAAASVIIIIIIIVTQAV